jgi:hypothetical protein
MLHPVHHTAPMLHTIKHTINAHTLLLVLSHGRQRTYTLPKELISCLLHLNVSFTDSFQTSTIYFELIHFRNCAIWNCTCKTPSQCMCYDVSQITVTLNLCSSFRVKDQTSHLYKTRGKVVLLYMWYVTWPTCYVVPQAAWAPSLGLCTPHELNGHASEQLNWNTDINNHVLLLFLFNQY